MALTRVSGGILKQPIDVGIITATSLNASGIVTAGTVQVGSATTIHTTGIDLGSGNVTSHNINSTGIITATSFVGPVTGNLTGNVTGNLTGNVTGNITATTGSFSGDVSIGGTLTYEDVTNIDAVGIITAQSGIHVTSGSVGIKTTAPNNTLTVGDGVQTSYAPSTAGNYLEIARTSGADAGLLINKNTGQWLVGIDNSDGANAPLRFEYGAAGSAHPGFGAGTLGMIIKHDGKIGIGTDDPNRKLVISQANSTAYSGTDFDQDYHVLKLNNYTDSKTVGMQFLIGANGEAAITATETSDGATDLIFGTRGSGNRAERLRITSDGSVGTGGLVASSGNLVVNSTIRSQNSSSNISYIGFTQYTGDTTVGSMFSYMGGDGRNTGYLNFSTNNAERLRIDSSGNIGVGTDGPGSLVDIASGDLEFSNKANSSAIQTINFSDGTQGRGKIRYLHDGDNLTFHTFSDERLRITGIGRVGIGTDNPATMLEVGNQSQTLAGAITISNGEAIAGGSGPLINLKHGPAGGTQRTHQIYSYIGNLRIAADSNENMELWTGGSESLGIHSSGNVNFYGGTIGFENSGGTVLQVVQSGVSYKPLTVRASDVTIGTGAGSAAERVRIDVDGNISINNTGSIRARLDLRQASGHPAFNIGFPDSSFYRNLGTVGPGSSDSSTGQYLHVRLRTVWNDSSMTMFRVTGYYPYSVYGESYVGMYRYGNNSYRNSPYGQVISNQGNKAIIHSVYNTTADPGYLVIVCDWDTSYNGLMIEHYGAGGTYGSYMQYDLEIIDTKRSSGASAQW